MGYGGDSVRFVPGEDVPVEVLATPDGEVANHSYGVELVGQNADYTEVQLVTTPGAGIGQLNSRPTEYEEGTAYEPGESVGTANLVLWYPVFVMQPVADIDPATAGVQEFAVNDRVMFDAGGLITAYDEGTAPAPYGRVFRTVADNVATAGRIQVARSGR